MKQKIKRFFFFNLDARSSFETKGRRQPRIMPIHVTDRLGLPQVDSILAIVRPKDWKPTSVESRPSSYELLSQDLVASYEEACDDLLRCNQLALRKGLDQWAVIFHPGGDL